jgi:hypothetical protein
MGNLYQFTNNLHVYEGWGGTDKYSETPDHWYRRNPTFLRWEFSSDNFDWGEAADFVEDPDFFLDSSSPRCRILRDNAGPMFNAWMAHKDGDDHLALHHVGNIHDEDWKEACARWITRRMTAK